MGGGETQKQPSRDVLSKSCSENIQQIYRRTSMPKCGFRTPITKKTSGRLLLETLRPTDFS